MENGLSERFLTLCFLYFICFTLNARVYYVDHEIGSDSFTGDSPTLIGNIDGPWKTISKVNESTFEPGDSILFRRGLGWNDAPLIPPNGGAAHGLISVEESIISNPLSFHLVDPENNKCIYFQAVYSFFD